MYSLACINLSSEAHVLHALGSSQYPVLKVPKGSGPTLAPRCGARKNYTSIPHAVSRKIFKKFFRPVAAAPVPCGPARLAFRPASRASAAGVSHYTSPRRFVKGVICKKEGDPKGFPSLSTIGGCDLTQRLLSAEHRTRKYRRQAWLARLPRA